ncbi:DUF1120 domain-containing protein [Pseudomonas sp. MH9.3]|uniref:DUF1120 domain-containing protein n=1 Tax=Pseudomonas sp. MH9.3 TaxID=3048630 RepID=UPI002AC91708|nr:DUF1120 domain-containing protein [Pseudomonas sp. MH9.3]MEB0105984.1 DUF1120 domain-containing protein [Pseudomonas sp. MH9.3]WPX78779.1 DUF1120 domain-containing protein [Pseudomonas sp. MH9.3]WQG58829.1 DUF1120 domain-containing protein [Pseudomonas sp. RTB3]
MGLKPALLALALLPGACAFGADECQLNLSESLVDFGLMNRAVALTPKADRLLGERRLSLTFNCPNTTDMSLFYRAMGAGIERFAFTARGSYGLQVGDALLDGRAVDLGLLAGSGQSPISTATSLRWRPEHGIVPMRAGVPVSGRSLSVQIQVSAWASADASRVNDAETWDESGVFDAINGGRSQELRLQARFAPAACTPSLSGGGTVDFGKLSVMDLNMHKETALPARPLIVSVACDAPSAFTLRLGDNRVGSATGPADDTLFGLGLDARQNRIGRYRLIFDPARTTADSWPQLYRTDSATGTSAWSSASASPLSISASRYLGFSASVGSTSGPLPIQQLSATASLEAVIAPLSSLDLASEVRLDGAATLEIHYP